jgi:hypothetical protein
MTTKALVSCTTYLIRALLELLEGDRHDQDLKRRVVYEAEMFVHWLKMDIVDKDKVIARREQKVNANGGGSVLAEDRGNAEE